MRAHVVRAHAGVRAFGEGWAEGDILRARSPPLEAHKQMTDNMIGLAEEVAAQRSKLAPRLDGRVLTGPARA